MLQTVLFSCPVLPLSSGYGGDLVLIFYQVKKQNMNADCLTNRKLTNYDIFAERMLLICIVYFLLKEKRSAYIVRFPAQVYFYSFSCRKLHHCCSCKALHLRRLKRVFQLSYRIVSTKEALSYGN